MDIAAPDSSILLRGLDTILAKVLERYPDVKFRLDLARNELRLSSSPTQESVLKYYQHALAELQQVNPSTTRKSPDNPKLKGANANAAGTGGSTSQPGSPKKGKGPCKFFMSDSGCKRGSSCPYTHEFLSKADRKQRCWTCGSTTHKQNECPTIGAKGSGKSPPGTLAPATNSSNASTPSPASVAKAQAQEETSTTPSVPADNSSTNTATSSTDDGGAAHREQMRQLLQEANSMLSKIKLMGLKVEETNQATEDLELFMRSAGLDRFGLALLDSGASHPLREAVDDQEFKRAFNVKVELADGRAVDLRQTSSGTLLSDQPSGTQPPIVPLGSLVQQLGCTVTWSKRRGFRVHHPEHGEIVVKMNGNCPMISEVEALKLISEIEEKNLGRLRQTTARSLWSQAATTGCSWNLNLDSYTRTGKRTSALAAMMDTTFPLELSTETERFAMVGPNDLDLSEAAGANYLEALPVNRRMRRKLLGTRWLVHLYDGKNDETAVTLKQLENDTTTILEIDLQRSKMFNMKGWSNAWRVLLWAACRGQVEGVIGGPPREGANELMRKLLYLWMVSEAGAEKDGLRKPFIFMEFPQGDEWWSSEEWSKLKDEYQLVGTRVTPIDGGGFFGATNMVFPYNNQNDETGSKPPSKWTPMLSTAIKSAIDCWHKAPDQLRLAHLLCSMEGKLEDMTEKELKRWAQHVRNGHVPFDKRCRTCVTNAGTGRPHRRVLTPSAYTLSVDIAGPFRRRGLDPDGKYRYALIGSYCMPKIEGYKDIDIPEEFKDEGAGAILPEEEDYLDEEEADDIPASPGDQLEMDQRNEEYQKFYEEVYKDVGDPMEYQTLLYMIPLKSRLKTDVNAAMRRLYLQLRQEGHPVTRVHSDRARELKSASLRQWLYEKDIWVTTGESQTPQQNGRAEAAVKILKKYTKVLLGASGLPRECWPLAMSYAAHRQRQRALNQASKDPPFGTKVSVKSKVFGTGNSYDLDPRWRDGRFVGYSADVRNGLIVRYDDGGFVTSCHVRQGLVDADAIVEPDLLEVDLPVPERRLRGKVRLAAIKELYQELEDMAIEMDVEEMYTPDDVMSIWSKLQRLPRPCRKRAPGVAVDYGEGSFYTGAYTHGGVSGVMNNTKRLPNTTAYLIKAAKEITGRTEFGCVAIVDDVAMSAHRDSHNQDGTVNTVTALTEFSNGEVWVEKNEKDYAYDDDWRQVRPELWVRGSSYRIEKGDTIQFPPGSWHKTEPWEGKRVVLLTYTPRLRNLSEADHQTLCGLGFDLPTVPSDEDGPQLRAVIDNFSEETMFDPPKDGFIDTADGDEWASSLSKLVEDQQDMIAELEEKSLVLRRLLEEEEILLEEYRRMGNMVNEEADHAHQMLVDLIEQTGDTMKEMEREVEVRQLKAALRSDEDETAIDDVEKYLSELVEELQVVLNVPLEQVKRHLERWVPAIDKELATLFKDGTGGTLHRVDIKDARAREAKGELIILPSKLVFTCKPPNQGAVPKAADMTKPKKELWRRKCRLVLCGNFAERPEGQGQAELYASGASAESLRIALVIAAACGWVGAGADIQGAFLLAPWPKHLRRYAITPPRTLILGRPRNKHRGVGSRSSFVWTS